MRPPARRFLVTRTETIHYSRVFDTDELAELFGEHFAAEGIDPDTVDLDHLGELLLDNYDTIAETVERHGDVISAGFDVEEVTA